MKKLCPPTARLEIEDGHGGEPYLVSPTSPKAQAALRALRSAFGHEPVLMREGGSIPIVNDFKKILGADSLLLGLALPDDNAHSPNEKFSLDCFEKGMVMGAWLWRELGTWVGGVGGGGGGGLPALRGPQHPPPPPPRTTHHASPHHLPSSSFSRSTGNPTTLLYEPEIVFTISSPSS